MLEREFQYYKSHEDEFIKQYKGKFIAIVGEEVKGVFDKELQAYQAMKDKYGLGKFLIQQCLEKEHRIQHYHSRVSFG